MMELFVTIFDGLQSLAIDTKSSIKEATDIFDPTLITDVFSSQSWIIINLNPIIQVKFVDL